MRIERTEAPYHARLQFHDAPSCERWLRRVPVKDSMLAYEMLAAQVALLSRSVRAGREQWRTLEVLYQRVSQVQADIARCYLTRPLPLSIMEYALWTSVVELWQALFGCYRACLEACLAPRASLGADVPLLSLRCLDLTRAMIREYHHAYREIPEALWRQLHSVYQRTEALGFAETGVTDPLAAAAPPRTCAGIFGQALLAHLANPYALSARQMACLEHWSGAWAAQLQIRRRPPEPGATALLAVDLASGRGARPASQVQTTTTIRYVALEQLGKSIRRTLAHLRRGADATSLGLGSDCRRAGTERLLTLLYIQWCGAGTGSPDGAREFIEEARASVGLAAAIRHIGAETPVNGGERSRAVRPLYLPATEQWRLASLSAPGFLTLARGTVSDAAIQHHQVVAIRRASARSVQLGVTQWLRTEEDGSLSVGLRLLSGTPRVVEFDTTAAQANSAEGSAGILLAVNPSVRMPSSLVVACGTFRPGRKLRLRGGERRAVRLTRLAEQGADFERAEFQFAD